MERKNIRNQDRDARQLICMEKQKGDVEKTRKQSTAPITDPRVRSGRVKVKGTSVAVVMLVCFLLSKQVFIAQERILTKKIPI
jgi:hypothetical protein